MTETSTTIFGYNMSPEAMAQHEHLTTAESVGLHEALESKLLSHGGLKVVRQPDPHLDALIHRGQTFSPKGKKRLREELHMCHRNSALYYAKHYSLGHGGTCEIVSGYGLTRQDGLWRQHSWVWDGSRVIETNVTVDLYFGVILTSMEALKFCFTEILAHLPGQKEFAKEMRKAA